MMGLIKSTPWHGTGRVILSTTTLRFPEHLLSSGLRKSPKNFLLNDNEMEPPRCSPGYDKRYKLRPTITAIDEQFLYQITESSKQSIDECMVKFKGRSSLKQYMLKKPIKRGFKVWAQCDAKTGCTNIRYIRERTIILKIKTWDIM